MTRIDVDAGRLHVAFRGLDRFLALKRHIEVPLPHVRGATADPGIRLPVGSLRSPGTNVPGLIVAGSYRKDGEWSFWSWRRSQQRLVVELADEHYTRLVLGVPDARAMAERIERALSPHDPSPAPRGVQLSPVPRAGRVGEHSHRWRGPRMDFGSMAKKAQDALSDGADKVQKAVKDNAGKIDGAVDKAGKFAKDKFPDRAGQIDQATGKAKGAVPRHENGAGSGTDVPQVHPTSPPSTTPPSSTPEVDRTAADAAGADSSPPSASGYPPPTTTPEVDRIARDQG